VTSPPTLPGVAEVEERVERFRLALLAVGADELRDGIRALPRAASQGLHKAAGTPFPALGRVANPVGSLRRVRDLPLLVTLADVIAQDSLETITDLLEDKADDPSVEDLRIALPPTLERHPMPIVRLMLASVAISNAPAADKCDEVIGDLPAPEEPEDAPAAPETTPAKAAPAGATDAVREARKERRQAQKDERRKEQEARARAQQALRDAKRNKPSAHAVSATAITAPVVTEVHRRPAQLTPEQAADFDVDDELVGSVVIALVPFDDDGPAEPGPQHKRRPSIVIGASPSSLLVRPCYSEGSAQSRRWQSHPLRDWVTAGLDRATSVEDGARVIPRVDAGEPLGRVSAEDWNALW
jgi:hypothetical protein